MSSSDTDLTAADVSWDLSGLLSDVDASSPRELVERAQVLADGLQHYKGTIAHISSDELFEMMSVLSETSELLSRAGHFTTLKFSENTADPEIAAEMQFINEQANSVSTKLLFIDLEWAEVSSERSRELLLGDRFDFCRHHLENMRRYQPHQLSEPEETVLSETSLTGASAWVRLFEEHTSAIEVDLPESLGGKVSLMSALANLHAPDTSSREQAAHAISSALEPGLRTRAFIYNTLLLDKSVDDRLRNYPTWITSRNMANEASDESVQALIDAVVARYDIPQKWYALKAQVLGVDQLRDFDRMASVATSDTSIGWEEGSTVVREAYASFSPELAGIVGRFIDERWIDAPVRPGKRGGAFCAYAVPSHHPYVLLNWTSTPRDVATLAHELGHGVHGFLAREQGIFHQSTPLTLAETASVFGETVTNNRLLSMLEDPGERFALLAATLEDSIATVFRQVAMNRFEDACHTERREVGEISVERFGDLWESSQRAMLGDSVEITEGYRNWWSYIPHFIATPGYVYAYAYGQLLALSVYAKFETQGDAFVPNYLDMLRAGGSMKPEDLTALVDCDLTDPGFWSAGLDIVEQQLTRASQAAEAAGRL
ncbi:MAG: M3 family oligoendopeptidase [Ilumatobacteraceae bacterium]